MRPQLPELAERLDRMLPTVFSRITAADRRTQGGAILGLAILCRVDAERWEGVAEAARISADFHALEYRVYDLAKQVEMQAPALASVLTESLLARHRLLVPTLMLWILEVHDHREAVQGVDQATFADWIGLVIATITATSTGPAPTPPPLARLMSAMVNTHGGAVLDPFCRSGELLAASIEHGRTHNLPLKAVGLTPANDDAALARVRFYFSQAQADILEVDGLRQPLLEDGRLRLFDEVICDAPFGRRINPYELAYSDAWHWLAHDGKGVTSEAAYLRLALAHLNRSGRAVVRVPPGLLFRGGSDAQLRRSLIHEDVLAVVVGLPSGLVPGSSIESALVLLDRAKSPPIGGQVLMIDASRTSPADPAWVDGIISRVTDSARAEGEFARWVDAQEIAAADFRLQPRAYLRAQDAGQSSERLANPEVLARASELDREAADAARSMDERVQHWLRRSD